MQIAKKIRLYPNKEQEELFWQFAGTSRWAWNESLAYRIDRYEKDGSNTTIQQGIEHIQDLKHNNPDYVWVKSIPEAITKQSIKDFHNFKLYLFLHSS